MNILGPDALVFGVDDVAACTRYLADYGLAPVSVTAAGGRFEALDGTCIIIAHKDDATIPPSMGTATMLRKTIYGVSDAATLQAIAQELSSDRDVRHLPDGSIEASDDAGFVLGFQLTVRRKIHCQPKPSTRPAHRHSGPRMWLRLTRMPTYRRGPCPMWSTSYRTPPKAEAFYSRLGFRCTDRFTGVVHFCAPQARMITTLYS